MNKRNEVDILLSKYLSTNELVVIEQILARGNTAEIRKRKEDIVIYEVSRKVKKEVTTANGQR